HDTSVQQETRIAFVGAVVQAAASRQREPQCAQEGRETDLRVSRHHCHPTPICPSPSTGTFVMWVCASVYALTRRMPSKPIKNEPCECQSSRTSVSTCGAKAKRCGATRVV